MEIRDPVHGSMYYTDSEVAILDTLEFQRLRAIKQLGYAEFSFPGATHNRYIHSTGVCHLAGLVFDSIFRAYPFSKPQIKNRFRQVLRLGSLLHDVGHGPLSHTTEQVMPRVQNLNIPIYEKYAENNPQFSLDRRATHEDYTIKFVTDSKIADTIKEQFSDISPIHVACLIDRTIECPDDFFIDRGLDFRPILSQIVSSELDVDRMDYLERDSYFCGTNYGRIDLHWLVQNLTSYQIENKVYLALNRRAIYAFDDFLLSRHHMHLMVYCHHKSIIYEEMLNKYLTSDDCTFVLPGDINEYTQYNDYKLHVHLASAINHWAKRIAERRPYKVLIELHSTSNSETPDKIKQQLEKEKIDVIWASSKARLSKYHTLVQDENTAHIYVVDQYDRWEKPAPIGQSTEIFNRYEGTRIIDRIFVAPESFQEAQNILAKIQSQN